MNTDLSLEHQVALLSPDEQDAILSDLDLDALQYDWHWNGRPSQLLPVKPEDGGDDWQIALALAGRGFGKTLMGAQWVRELDRLWPTLGRDQGNMRFALLARTAADVRDVMIEGQSGIMNIYPPSLRDDVVWIPSRRSLTLPGGSTGLVYSSEEPDQLRGPAFHCFPAGTMVRTEQGQTPIEQIKPGDLVWTRKGLRPVSVTSSSDSVVMTLRHEAGELTGTPEHPVLTQRGWMPLNLVSPTDTIVGWDHITTGTPTISDAGSAGGKTEALSGDHTGRGRLSTDPFLPVTRSTISTLTRQTTLQPTSLPLLPKITGLSTEQPSWSYLARNADSSFSNMRRAATPSIVRAAGTQRLSSIKSQQMPSVLKSLSSVSIAEPNFVPAVESIAVKDASTWGRVTRVYNLMVKDVPEFFADDILVHNCSWADEMASYKQVRSMAEGNLTAWENLRIGTRLGTISQILATTTPKRVPILKQLLAEAKDQPKKFLLRRGKTIDNVKLSANYLDTLMGLYAGTTLGKQELEGEMLDDVVGAMTSEQIIQAYRVDAVPKGIPWIKIIGVDPSVAERPHDECGIVVVYISNTWPILKRHAFVVDDLSLRASPAIWGDVVVKAAHEHGAIVVAEVNQGANLVKQMVKQSASAAGLQNPAIREVWSSKSKSVRSEPVGGAYSRGRIHHVNVLAELEDQSTTWVHGESGYSPDRMDALVHACAAGMFPEALIHGSPGTTTLHNVANQRIPMTRQTQLPARRGAM